MKKKDKKSKDAPVLDVIPCTLHYPALEDAQEAASQAMSLCPQNAVQAGALAALTGLVLGPEHLSVLVSRYWGAGGVRLTVGFPFDNPAADLRARILSHMNAWSQWANVTFVESNVSPQVRIARTRGQGYWSYLGTDILGIHPNEPTMNLEAFTMNTPESEYRRVVRHETGHTLGFPHEHLRSEIIARLDVEKTIAYFMRTQGWSRQTVIQQVLTPVSESSLLGTPHADEVSIMTYQLPASITKDGRPIPGGTDIDAVDQAFVARIYPKADVPVPPPPVVGPQITVVGDISEGTWTLTKIR